MLKKVLIITYYWPPAGGPGVQRWLKFVKYLPENGYQPIVYIPENPNYPIIDQSLLEDIPEAVTIIRQPINEPYRIAEIFSKRSTKVISSGVIPQAKKQSLVQRLLLYIRGNFFIPDARKSWIKPSIDYLSDRIQKDGIDLIITTGPPHSLHLIGLGLKKALNINWIADFRDPWTTIGYHKALKLSKSAAQKHLALEKEVLNMADHILVTSENTKSEFTDKTKQPITVITNGYDVHQIGKVEKDEKFSIAHIGSLLSERNPVALWQVLGELIAENKNFQHHFILKLIGVVSDDVLMEIKHHIPSENIDIVGYVNHKEALIAQKKSRLLLLIEIDSEATKAIIPGKLFEYMVAETPIVAIGPDHTDVETIVKNTNTGRYFNYDSKQELKAYLASSFENYRQGVLSSFPIGLQQYSRKSLTRKLADVLNSFS